MNLRSLMAYGAAAFVCLAGVRPAWGARVSQVSEDQSQVLVTQEGRPLAAGEPVAIQRDAETLAAGVVESVNGKGALISVRRKGARPIAEDDMVTYSRDSSQVMRVLVNGTDFEVSHPLHLPWVAGDIACLARGEATIGCGRIVQAAPDRAKLQLTGSVAWGQVGDFVRPAYVESTVTSVDGDKRQIRVRQGAFEKWQDGERACAVVVTSGTLSKLTCGPIGEARGDEAVLKAEGDLSAVKPGTWVRGRPKTAYVYQVASDGTALVATHHVGLPWAAGDKVCAQRGGYEIACGKITQVNGLAAMVDITAHSEYSVQVGDPVRIAGMGNPEYVKRAGMKVEDRNLLSLDAQADVAIPRFGSVMAGINFHFPELRYEQAVFRNFAVGAGATLIDFSTGGGTLKGIGLLGTVSFYEAGWFSGLWVQAGGGLLSLKVSMNGNEESLSALMVSVVSGWRWQLSSGLNFGFGVGMNYLSRVRTDNVPFSGSNLLPSVRLDVGFAF